MEIVHKPVLLAETLEYLSPIGEKYEQNAFMVDSTLGEGGHSNAFLTKYDNLKIIGLDADKNIQLCAKERLACFGQRMDFFNGWFNDFYANYPENLPRPNLILFDLGISVFHYEKSKRGFSFRYDEKLDMRLNDEQGKSAADIVNTMCEDELANLIFNYGDERYSRRIAHAIVESRQFSKIVSSKELADIIFHAVPKDYRYGAIHPATKTFQALRIEVNDELSRLAKALNDAFDCLQVDGKMGVITFHSGEDRIVKNVFKTWGKNCTCPPEVPICRCGGTPLAFIMTKKPVEPTKQEIEDNSPSRSAKLRVIRKLRERTVKKL